MASNPNICYYGFSFYHLQMKGNVFITKLALNVKEIRY